MALFAWTKYKCPQCNYTLGDREIAKIHFTKECPHCNKPIYINGHETLTNTSTAGILAFMTLGIYVAITIEIVPLPRILRNVPELLGYILFFIYLGLGVALAVVITRIYKSLMLRYALYKLKDKQPKDDEKQ